MDIHTTHIRNLWRFQTWRNDEINWENENNILKTLDELDRTKAIIPITDSKAFNIITTAGLTEMAKRNIGTSSTSNTHHAVGIGTRTEDLSDTELQSQVGGRRTIQSKSQYAGSERYATAFNKSQVGNANRSISEAAIFTAGTGGVMMMRVTTDQPAAIHNTASCTISSTIQHENDFLPS